MLDDAFKIWEAAGPLSDLSQQLFEAIETARGEGHSEMAAWVSFFRSLTEHQQKAVLAMMEAIDRPH